jgi:O-antigen/teichoic acid export membrane protein
MKIRTTALSRWERVSREAGRVRGVRTTQNSEFTIQNSPIHRLMPTSLFRRYLSAAGYTLGSAVIGRGIAFVNTVLLVRWLGPGNYGVYAVLLSLLMVTSSFGNLRLDLGLARYLPQFLLRRSSAERELVKRAWTLGVALGVVTAIGFEAFAGLVATRVYARPELTGYVRLIAPAIALTVILQMGLSTLAGLQDYRSVAVVQVLASVLQLVASLAGWAWLGLRGAVLGYVASAGIAAIVAAFVARQRLGESGLAGVLITHMSRWAEAEGTEAKTKVLALSLGEGVADGRGQVRGNLVIAASPHPSPVPRRLVRAPVAVHPLPSGEGKDPITIFDVVESGEGQARKSGVCHGGATLARLTRFSVGCLFASLISISGYWCGTAILTRYRGFEAAALFSVAYNFGAFTLFAPGYLLGPAGPFLSEAWAAGRVEEFRELVRRNFRLAASLTVPIAVFFAVVARPLVTLVYGARFAPAWPAASLLSLAGVFFIGIAAFGGAFAAAERVWESVALNAFWLALFAALSLASAPAWGPAGVGLSLFVSLGVGYGIFCTYGVRAFGISKAGAAQVAAAVLAFGSSALWLASRVSARALWLTGCAVAFAVGATFLKAFCSPDELALARQTVSRALLRWSGWHEETLPDGARREPRPVRAERGWPTA